MKGVCSKASKKRYPFDKEEKERFFCCTIKINGLPYCNWFFMIQLAEVSDASHCLGMEESVLREVLLIRHIKIPFRHYEGILCIDYIDTKR